MTNTIMTLDATLQELITTVVAGAEKAGGFVAQEAPIVIEQLLAWKLTVNLIGFSFSMVLLLILLWLAGWMINSREGDEFYVVLAIFLWVGQSILFWTSLTWLKIAIAPKLYLLEYAADLIK